MDDRLARRIRILVKLNHSWKHTRKIIRQTLDDGPNKSYLRNNNNDMKHMLDKYGLSRDKYQGDGTGATA